MFQLTSNEVQFCWLESGLDLCIGWIPRNFEIFTFKPKLSFWGKISKVITRMNFRIFTNSPFIYDNWFFNEKVIVVLTNFPEIHIWGNFVKIRSFIFVIFTQKWQFQFAIVNFEILKNSAYLCLSFKLTSAKIKATGVVFRVNFFTRSVFLLGLPVPH